MIEKTDSDDLHQLPGQSNIAEICDLSIGARTIEQASAKFAELLATQQLALLFHAIYDIRQEQTARNIYVDLPDRVIKMCEQFDSRLGCPAVQQARRLQNVFDAVGFDYPDKADFAGLRYIQELRNLGYAEIAVVPIFAAEEMHIFFVGSNYSGAQDAIHQHLYSTAGQFVASVLIRFALDGSSVGKSGLKPGNSNRKTLSERETRCLFLCSQGKSNFEISKSIDLSEHTVNHILNAAYTKLGAANRTDAVTRAISMGLIELQSHDDV